MHFPKCDIKLIFCFLANIKWQWLLHREQPFLSLYKNISKALIFVRWGFTIVTAGENAKVVITPCRVGNLNFCLSATSVLNSPTVSAVKHSVMYRMRRYRNPERCNIPILFQNLKSIKILGHIGGDIWCNHRKVKDWETVRLDTILHI